MKKTAKKVKMYLIMAGFMDAKGGLWPQSSGDKIPVWTWMAEKQALKAFGAIKVSDFEEDEVKIASFCGAGLRPFASLESFEFPTDVIKHAEAHKGSKIGPNEYLTEYANYDFKDEREKYFDYSEETKIGVWVMNNWDKLQRMYVAYKQDHKQSQIEFVEFAVFIHKDARDLVNVEAN